MNRCDFMKNKVLLKTAILLGLAVSFLCGCTCPNISNYSLKYGSYCSLAKQNLLAKKLRKQDVQVSYFGDDIYIIIPSHILFCKKSANLNRGSLRVLELVAKFLACYQKITVRVVGFSNILENKHANVVFAKKQAQVISDYLWRRQTDTRLIYAAGKNSATTPAKAKWGNRVEIITKRLP